MGLADEHTECAAGETMEVETEIRARGGDVGVLFQQVVFSVGEN